MGGRAVLVTTRAHGWMLILLHFAAGGATGVR